MKCDFHLHSVFSDGSDTPEKLAAACRAAKLEAVALTDHDTAAGVPRFLTACVENGVKGIAGIELSVDTVQGTLHVLGLGIDSESPELNAALTAVRKGRDDRNRQILVRLNELGFAVSEDEVRSTAGGEILGRVHFAQVLTRKRYFSSVADVFARCLKKGQPGYVDRYRLSQPEALKMIQSAGGVPVLAHPLLWTQDEVELEARVRELMVFGLKGLEIYYSGYRLEQIVFLLRLAKRLGLAVSAGSDYHGNGKPDVSLGRLTETDGLTILDLLGLR